MPSHRIPDGIAVLDALRNVVVGRVAEYDDTLGLEVRPRTEHEVARGLVERGEPGWHEIPHRGLTSRQVEVATPDDRLLGLERRSRRIHPERLRLPVRAGDHESVAAHVDLCGLGKRNPEASEILLPGALGVEEDLDR